MLVLWRVFEHALPHVVLLREVDQHTLEPAPAHRQHQGIKGLEHTLVPAMLLDPHLHIAHATLLGRDHAHYDWVGGVKVLDKLTWNTYWE